MLIGTDPVKHGVSHVEIHSQLASPTTATRHPANVIAVSIYAHSSGLRDVVGGSSGYCGGDHIGTGVVGYHGPTGLGSLIDLRAFAAR